MKLAKTVYLLTSTFPNLEKYGLISQINRSAVSIPSNIAEGSSRTSNKEFAHFLSIATGSLFELETQIILSVDFGFAGRNAVENIITEIIMLQKMISSFKKTLIKD